MKSKMTKSGCPAEYWPYLHLHDVGVVDPFLSLLLCFQTPNEGPLLEGRVSLQISSFSSYQFLPSLLTRFLETMDPILCLAAHIPFTFQCNCNQTAPATVSGHQLTDNSDRHLSTPTCPLLQHYHFSAPSFLRLSSPGVQGTTVSVRQVSIQVCSPLHAFPWESALFLSPFSCSTCNSGL